MNALILLTVSFYVPVAYSFQNIIISKTFDELSLISAPSKGSSLFAKKEATFGCGCFWKPAEEILKKDGVISTVAGYTGKSNAVEAPNYESVCYSRDWVEGVRVIYDDEKLSYEELLDTFYTCQEPRLGSRQYGSFIFPHDEQQLSMAQKWMEGELGSSSIEMRSDGFEKKWTQIEPLTSFFQAEGYHQRYWEKQRPRFAAIVLCLVGASGFFDSILGDGTFISPSSFHTVCNGLAIAISLFQLLERKIDNKVIQL